MIIPTIFAHNKKEFSQRFQKLLPISKNLQIDFMDGKFVKSKSISLSNIPNLKKYKKNFEAHLMVKNPDNYLKKLKKKGFNKIIFHYISTNDSEKTIKKIKQLKLSAWLAINPQVSIKKIKVQIDGGVNDKTLVLLAKLGVNYINSGSYISDSKNPGQTLKKLNNLYEKYKK